MADTSSATKPGSSGSSQQQAEPGPVVDDEVFDMNNNDPNNNTEFNDQPEVIEEIEEEEVNKEEDIQFKLLTEARAIHGVLNRYTINEIYSYLEASIDHPQRMQFVMNGFLARDMEEGDNANNSVDDIQVIEPAAPKRASNSTNSEDSPVAKKEKLIELDDTTSLSPSSNNGRDVDASVYSISSSDDEANIPAEIPQEPIVIPEADANNALVDNNNVCKEQITYLKELFPKMDSKMLEDRYMAVFPIEGENSLNVLVVQMLDIQEADIAVVADVSAPVVPDIVEIPQDRQGPSTVPIPPVKDIKKSEPTVIKKPTDMPGPSSSKGAGPSTSGGLLPNSKTNPVPSTNKDPGPSINKDPGPSTSKDPDPAGVLDESWDEPDGDTVSVDPEIQEQMSYLMAVLPNADPTFLEEKCKEFKENNAGMEAFIADAMENKNYPTLADFNKREEVNKDLKRFTGRLSVKDFLELFPDPETTFKNKEHKNDPEYTERTMFYLLGRFRNVSKNSINAAIKRNNNLTKVVEDLSRGVGVSYLKKLRPVAKEPEHLKNCRHLLFLQEVTYVEKKSEIEEYKKRLEEEKRLQFEQAKARGELLECGCCFDSECLITNMSACPDGHLFCKECIQRYAENVVGDGKLSFECLDGECKEEFSLKVLQDVLTPKMFSRLVQKKQLEEIQAANIEGLETCPFCEFSTIPAPGDRIFHCDNPDCGRDSCRECKEPSHIPLRCDELEKDEEVKARKFLEDRMTEALVRECWKCHKKFVKLDGCNKMTCSCGAKMCYLCRQPITGYDHFSNNAPNAPQDKSKCPLWVNNEELHVRVVTEEAKKAMEELKAKDPNVSLKHDPTKVLPTVQAQPNQQQVPRVVIQPIDGHRQRMDMNINMALNQPGQAVVIINGQRVHPLPAPPPPAPAQNYYPHRNAAYAHQAAQQAAHAQHAAQHVAHARQAAQQAAHAQHVAHARHAARQAAQQAAHAQHVAHARHAARQAAQQAAHAQHVAHARHAARQAAQQAAHSANTANAALQHAGNVVQQVYHNIEHLVNFAQPREAHVQPLHPVHFHHHQPIQQHMLMRQVGPRAYLNIQQQQAQWQYRQQRQ